MRSIIGPPVFANTVEQRSSGESEVLNPLSHGVQSHEVDERIGRERIRCRSRQHSQIAHREVLGRKVAPEPSRDVLLPGWTRNRLRMIQSARLQRRRGLDQQRNDAELSDREGDEGIPQHEV